MSLIDLQYSQGIISLQPNQGDETPICDGSLLFNGGMFSNQRANKLESNQFASAQNYDIDQLGQITTRRGVLALGVSPATSQCQGLTSFSTPSFNYLTQVQNKNLYYYSSGTAWIKVTGYTASATTLDVQFAQMVNYLYWVDDSGYMYRWDGTTVTAGVGTTWGTAVTTYPVSGMSGIAYHQNRLFAWGDPNNPQYLYPSDILIPNFSALNIIGVSTGDGDNIVGGLSWISNLFLVFKQRSIYAVDITNGVGASASIQKIHNTIGCVSQRTIAQIGSDKVGQDVYFLAKDGVRTIQTTIQTGQQGATPPISYPINDWIQRINWSYAGNATGIYWNNRYFLSVPIDNSTYNNYTFVYNIINQSWSGYWTGWTPTQFAISSLLENPTLVFGDTAGNVNQWQDFISVINETAASFEDNGAAIPSMFTSKAYNFAQFQNKKVGNALELEFYDSLAYVSVGVSLDGQSTTTLNSSYDTSTNPGFSPPITPPFTIAAGGIERSVNDLLSLGEFREIQVVVTSTSGKVAMKTISLLGFIRLPYTSYPNG